MLDRTIHPRAEIERLIGKDVADQRSIWKPFTAAVLVRMIGNVLGVISAIDTAAVG